jgi:outer membrane protein assembly factor BamB
MNRRFLVVLLCLASPSCALADDWPQWRGPERTGHVPAGAAVPATLPPAPTVVFKAALGNGLASPVVASGRVFILDVEDNKEIVRAFDAGTGQPVWSAPLDAAHKDSQSPAGPRCTPVVDGGLVYAQSCRGQLAAFGAADGKPVWQANFVKDFGASFVGEKGQAQGAVRHGYNGSPLTDGGRLIALVGGKENAAVVAFDKATGKVVWKAQTGTPAYAPPVIATVAGRRQLLAFMVEGLMSLDPEDGELLWQVPLKTAFGRHVTTPTVIGDTVLVASHQFGLTGIRVTKDGDALKAERAWTSKEAAINFCSPVAVGGHLYALGPQKNLICVDPTTGKIAWSKEGFSVAAAGNAHAGLLVMGPNLLVLTDGGALVLVAADPTAYKEVGRTQVAGTNWCMPAYAQGVLYLRDQRDLYGVRLVQ